MSLSGVLLVNAGQPSEFVPLADWQREKLRFDRLVRIPFFRNYLLRKVSVLITVDRSVMVIAAGYDTLELVSAPCAPGEDRAAA